jgi:hypothetical protein
MKLSKEEIMGEEKKKINNNNSSSSNSNSNSNNFKKKCEVIFIGPIKSTIAKIDNNQN